MNRAARITLTLAVLLAAAAGAAVYLWMRPVGEGDRVPDAAAGGPLFAIHAAPRPIADLAFEDEKAGKHTLADFRGKVILLNIWATWCVPCREEMPALDRLQRKLGGPAFEVIALSIDSDGAPAVRQFYEKTGVRSLAIYVDPTMQAGSTVQIVGVPTTLLIDRDGLEVGRRNGPARWDEPEALQAIKARMELQ